MSLKVELEKKGYNSDLIYSAAKKLVDNLIEKIGSLNESCEKELMINASEAISFSIMRQTTAKDDPKKRIGINPIKVRKTAETIVEEMIADGLPKGCSKRDYMIMSAAATASMVLAQIDSSCLREPPDF